MRALTVVLSLTVAVSTAAAQEKTPFTIDTMWAIQRVGTPAVSPDGTQVAYTVTTYDVAENRGNADIWIVPDRRWHAAPRDDQPGVRQRAGVEPRRQATGVCVST